MPRMARAGDTAGVTKARIVSSSALTIKPCEAVTLIVEVELTRPIPEEDWCNLLGRFSQVVLVNGRAYRNRLYAASNLNDAAEFHLLPGDAAPDLGDERHKTYSFAVTSFLDGEDRTCLFLDPGRYSIELLSEYVPVKFEVTVEEPTPAESLAIRKIAELEVLLFLFDPSDRQHASPKVLDMLEELAAQDIAHARMLSLSVGIGRLATGKLGQMPEAEMRRETERIYALLNRHCDGPMISELEELAAYQCGFVANALARWEQDETRAAELNRRRDQLWDRVENSRGLSEEARNIRMRHQTKQPVEP